MIRALLTTTAVTALLTTGALAEDPAKTADAAKAAQTSNAASVSANDMSGERYVRAAKGQILASAVIGKSVYNEAGENGEEIGEVNDVVISSQGDVKAIVIDVGGFLGLGGKEVAVNYDRIAWNDRDGERILTLDVGEKELDSAPRFDRSVFENDMMGIQSSVVPDQATSDGESVAGDLADDVKQFMNEDETDQASASADSVAGTGTSADDGQQASSGESLTRAADGELAGTNVDPTVLSADDVIGTEVYGARDTDLGDVDDVIVSPEGNLIAYIVDVGGFLGLGEKPVALEASALDVAKTSDGDMRIRTALSEDELKSYPTYSQEAYKANPDAVLVR